MTIEEKAQEYQRKTLLDYNGNGIVKSAFIAGYNTAKEEAEWKTFETPPEFGRLIVLRNFYRDEFRYQVFVYDNNDYFDRYLRNGYEWKYID